MSVTRSKLTKKFTAVPNAIITDHNLSSGALRVYLYLLSKPDGWKVINADIQNQLNIKQAQTLANFWKELIILGWVTRSRVRDKDNKIRGGYDCKLNDVPVLADGNVEDATLGNIHNMEKPHYGKSVNMENPQYINNTKKENKTDLNNTNPPTPEIKTGMGDKFWLKQVEQLNLEFTNSEIQTLDEWIKYKSSTKPLSAYQIELTLKLLAEHKKDGFNIVNMIHKSIASGYSKIMEPTTACIQKTSDREVNSKYKSPEYILPRNEAEKKELWNYLQRCYFNKIDPRNGKPMTSEQISHVGRHFKNGLSQRVSQDKYIYINEVETGVCLLEQKLRF
jgi:hypothetical protein